MELERSDESWFIIEMRFGIIQIKAAIKLQYIKQHTKHLTLILIYHVTHLFECDHVLNPFA